MIVSNVILGTICMVLAAIIINEVRYLAGKKWRD